MRSAHASKAVKYKEPIENVMAQCGWKRKSTFFTHYLRPVAMGIKPTSLGPLSLPDLTRFYCPLKLMDNTSPAVPDENYVLLSEVFVKHPEAFPSPNIVTFIPVIPEEQLPIGSITDPMSEADKENRKLDMVEAAARDREARGACPFTVTDTFSATGNRSSSRFFVISGYPTRTPTWYH